MNKPLRHVQIEKRLLENHIEFDYYYRIFPDSLELVCENGVAIHIDTTTEFKKKKGYTIGSIAKSSDSYSYGYRRLEKVSNLNHE